MEFCQQDPFEAAVFLSDIFFKHSDFFASGKDAQMGMKGIFVDAFMVGEDRVKRDIRPFGKGSQLSDEIALLRVDVHFAFLVDLPPPVNGIEARGTKDFSFGKGFGVMAERMEHQCAAKAKTDCVSVGFVNQPCFDFVFISVVNEIPNGVARCKIGKKRGGEAAPCRESRSHEDEEVRGSVAFNRSHAKGIHWGGYARKVQRDHLNRISVDFASISLKPWDSEGSSGLRVGEGE